VVSEVGLGEGDLDRWAKRPLWPRPRPSGGSVVALKVCGEADSGVCGSGGDTVIVLLCFFGGVGDGGVGGVCVLYAAGVEVGDESGVRGDGEILLLGCVVVVLGGGDSDGEGGDEW
jgi:hypothetical protein